MENISEGNYVFLRRGDVDKIVYFRSNGTVTFRKDRYLQDIELKNALGYPYLSAFRTNYLNSEAEDAEDKKKNKNVNKVKRCVLEYVGNMSDIKPKSVSVDEKGRDNRNLIDKNEQNQLLKMDTISELKDQGASSSEIIEKLVSNSTTFNLKTEFSQEKYLKKKDKVHADLIVFMKPTISILSEYFFNKDPAKILNLRMDTLGQMLSYANVHSGGKYLIYETGCSSLLVASVLHRLGGNGIALHVHLGNIVNRTAIVNMNFSPEGLKPLRSLDAYYLINPPLEKSENCNNMEPPSKKQKVENQQISSISNQESENSVAMLNERDFDGLLIAGKEDPFPILKRFLPHLAPSSQFVVYSYISEPLLECYYWVKAQASGVINVHLFENWMRFLQVEPERSHPEVNMNANSGYVLVGTTTC